MRMTALLLVLFCVPLVAGDLKPLEDAVVAFRSDDFAVRQAATRAVHEHLEKELAPLLEAMRSEDPEVARRAREALEGFLPRREPAEGTVGNLQNNWGQLIQIIQAGNNRIRLVRNGAWVAINQGQKHTRRIGAFGLQGYPCTQDLLRKQLGLAAGRGYVVQKVTRRSAAQKAGLQPLDIILSVDGLPVMQPETLYNTLGKKHTWLDRTIKVLRRGKLRSLRANP